MTTTEPLVVDIDSDQELNSVFDEVKASFETIVESLTAAVKGLKELKKATKSSDSVIVTTKKGPKKLKDVIAGANKGNGGNGGNGGKAILAALQELN